MKVKIANTNNINELQTGNDSYIEDLIAGDTQYDDDDGVYVMDQDSYDTWTRYIDDYTAAQSALDDLMDDLSDDPALDSRDLDNIRYQLLSESGGYDTMDQPSYLLKAVNDYRGNMGNNDN